VKKFDKKRNFLINLCKNTSISAHFQSFLARFTRFNRPVVFRSPAGALRAEGKRAA
jgi:hypothetical protein